jgi:hypothetical protein
MSLPKKEGRIAMKVREQREDNLAWPIQRQQMANKLKITKLHVKLILRFAEVYSSVLRIKDN